MTHLHLKYRFIFRSCDLNGLVIFHKFTRLKINFYESKHIKCQRVTHYVLYPPFFSQPPDFVNANATVVHNIFLSIIWLKVWIYVYMTKWQASQRRVTCDGNVCRRHFLVLAGFKWRHFLS